MDFPDKFKNHIMPDNIHILNVCFTVDKLGKSKGGTAGNIAYTMKLLGSEPIIISSVGKDGDDYLNYLKEQGISIDCIAKDNNKFTASCYITTDLDDNQITAFHNGALGSCGGTKSLLRDLVPQIVLSIIAPTQKDIMMKHLKECSDRGARVMFDPGQQIPAFSDNELAGCIEKAHFLIGNDYEIKMIGKRLGKEAINSVEILIITLGDKGSVIRVKNIVEAKLPAGSLASGEITISACRPEKVIDPTGAGDAWRAGFLAGCEKGFDLKTCGQMGSVCASFAIEKYGTQEHKFSISEFSERYVKLFSEEMNL
jgi:adenosine kinase